MGELNLNGGGDFLKFLFHEERLNDADLAALRYLVLKYPYCQPLHFAYASALKDTGSAEYESYLAKAAAYAPRREILYQFIHHPEQFRVPAATLNEGQEAVQESQTKDEAAAPEGQVQRGEESQVPETEDATFAAVETVIPDTEHVLEESIRISVAEEEAAETTGEPEAELYITEEIASAGDAFLIEETSTAGNISGDESISDNEEATVEEENAGPADEKIKVESVASLDYFVFNRSAIDPLKTGNLPPAEPEIPATGTEETASDVSRYDDYTLPYTFLWWLHKTRKEYEATYQPYVRNPSRELKSYRSGELNQQIIENIFHIQPELNTFQAASVATTIEFELRKKEDEIIEKFIREEPQIRPPQPDKLDTENKARKSSEDSLELVSETLAKIYMDQMLYHKAIDIYRKLSLKFPDKKLYFAGQIEELEKKIS